MYFDAFFSKYNLLFLVIIFVIKQGTWQIFFGALRTHEKKWLAHIVNFTAVESINVSKNTRIEHSQICMQQLKI